MSASPVPGGVATLLNGWWQSDELAGAVAEVDCRLIIADGPRAKRLDAVAHDARVIALDDTLPLAHGTRAAGRRTCAPTSRLPELTGDDLATILFTLGLDRRCRKARSATTARWCRRPTITSPR